MTEDTVILKISLQSSGTRFRFSYQASRTSQRGRLFNYLNELDKGERQFRLRKALNNFYLVEALLSEGIEEGEDIKEIGYRCVAELEAQAEAIKWSLDLYR